MLTGETRESDEVDRMRQEDDSTGKEEWLMGDVWTVKKGNNADEKT